MAVDAVFYVSSSTSLLLHSYTFIDSHVQEATDWLSAQSYVEAGGIGVTAVSWGAEFAAMMAVSFPEKVTLKKKKKVAIGSD